MERLKKKDMLEEMLQEITGEFPALSRVFVTERDMYLARSLKFAAQPLPCDHTETGKKRLPVEKINLDKINFVSCWVLQNMRLMTSKCDIMTETISISNKTKKYFQGLS